MVFALLPLALGAAAQYDRSFERELFKTRFEQEVKFRAAAIHVAWAAEALCDETTQVEPFVLLSVHAMRRRLDDRDMALFREVTGMDGKWRVVWADEGAPDALHLRRLPSRPYDPRVDAWLDPARHHLPVRLRFQAPGSGTEFTLRQQTPP